MSRFAAKITFFLSLQWSFCTNPLTFQTPSLTRLPGPSLEVECAGLELLGVAVGLSVPFPEPGADATTPLVGGAGGPWCLVWSWVALGWKGWKGVGDPLQNCCR